MIALFCQAPFRLIDRRAARVVRCVANSTICALSTVDSFAIRAPFLVKNSYHRSVANLSGSKYAYFNHAIYNQDALQLSQFTLKHPTNRLTARNTYLSTILTILTKLPALRPKISSQKTPTIQPAKLIDTQLYQKQHHTPHKQTDTTPTNQSSPNTS